MDTHQVINGADLVRRFRNEIEYLDFARILEKGRAAGTDERHIRRDDERRPPPGGEGAKAALAAYEYLMRQE